MKAEEVKAATPFYITHEDEVIGVFADPDAMMVIGDMHPWAQRRFRAMENRIRSGMPKKTES